MPNDEHATPRPDAMGKDMNVVVGVSPGAGQGGGGDVVTARKAGGLVDMKLPVSPAATPLPECLENMAKAINLALQSDFLETELERVYSVARVSRGKVQVLHRDYIGLGDGILAKVGKAARSIQLTLRGPDPASPEGKAALRRGETGSVKGLFNLIGRKLDLLQEFEDKVPMFVEQMLDRLEAARMIQGWNRTEWTIETATIGLDISIAPVVAKKPRKKKQDAADAGDEGSADSSES
jgi:hypothetical protein